MIGLAGAHRAGKTTLAREVAKQRGIDFIGFSTVAVMRDMGLEPKDIRTLEDRIRVQRKLVEACDRTFGGRKTHFISDRTPLDVAAYLLCDVGQEITPAQEVEIVEMVEDCIDITNAAFGMAILIEPWIPYVAEHGKPAPNRAYQWHQHYTCAGLLADVRTRVKFWSFGREITDLEERVEMVLEIYEDEMEDDVHRAAVVMRH